MSTVAIIVVTVLAVVLLLLVGGILGARRRDRRRQPRYEENVAEADRALEDARATDRGWNRVLLEGAAREGLERERPEFEYEDLFLVLVDDRPGTEEDRAHFMATGARGEVRLILAREGDDWIVEVVEVAG
jgi:hypothetical protein